MATILVIDDDTAARTVIVEMLTENGHQTVEAREGGEGLELFNEGKFDIVITDMSMPKMSGLQLSRKISQIREDLPIILISGFSDLLDDHNLSDYGIRELIHKPIRKVMLAQAISNILTKQDN